MVWKHFAGQKVYSIVKIPPVTPSPGTRARRDFKDRYDEVIVDDTRMLDLASL